MACLPGSSCRVISFGIPHPHQSMSHSFPAWTSQAIQRRWGTAIVNRGASAVWASFRQICLVCEWNTHRGKRFNVIPLFARVGNWGSARVSFGNDLWLLETLVFANAFIQTASLVEFSERRKEGRKEGMTEGKKKSKKDSGRETLGKCRRVEVLERLQHF